MAQEVINQFKEKTGDGSFDKQIDSEGKPKKKTKKEGTRARPFNVGLFQEVTDISWGSGQFTFVGGSLGDINTAQCQSGWAEDGQNWFANAGFVIGGPLSSLNVSVRGEDSNGDMIILAGGSFFIQLGTFHGSPIGYFESMMCMSADDGRSWQQVSCPQEGHLFKDGSIQAVGYDPKAKQFFARSEYFEVGVGTTNLMFAGSGGGGFGELSDGSSYPQKTKLCDLGSEAHADVRYVSSNSSKQIIKTNDEDGNPIELSIASISPPAPNPVSLAARAGVMVVICNPGGAGSDRFAFVSTDGGGSWEPVLTELSIPFSGNIFVGSVSCS